jgi:hypothetical protein
MACPASPPHYQRDPIQTLKTAFLGEAPLIPSSLLFIPPPSHHLITPPLVHSSTALPPASNPFLLPRCSSSPRVCQGARRSLPAGLYQRGAAHSHTSSIIPPPHSRVIYHPSTTVTRHPIALLRLRRRAHNAATHARSRYTAILTCTPSQRRTGATSAALASERATTRASVSARRFALSLTANTAPAFASFAFSTHTDPTCA